MSKNLDNNKLFRNVPTTFLVDESDFLHVSGRCGIILNIHLMDSPMKLRVTSLTLIWVAGVVILPPPLLPYWFSFNNSKIVKAVTLAAFSNILLVTFVTNLISLTRPSLQT